MHAPSASKMKADICAPAASARRHKRVSAAHVLSKDRARGAFARLCQNRGASVRNCSPEEANRYDPRAIEPVWQARWQKDGVFVARRDPAKKKYFVMEMFPYPSGRLHMGHVRNYTMGDVVARVRRMQGYAVLYPMGWDAFGLPAENAAIKAKVHPRTWTFSNIEHMRQQFVALGLSYDWSRELTTCEPEYFVHEQRIFIEMWNKGLAYRKGALVNWCDTCGTVLANEQVEDGVCWRCHNPVRQRELEQWFLKITDYAEQLLNDVAQLEGKWPEKVLRMQENWIGRSVGARATFALERPVADTAAIEVFTTRPDTLYGVTFLSIAPEHPLALKLAAGTDQEAAVSSFVERVRKEDKIKRGAEDYVKEGVDTGARCDPSAHGRTAADLRRQLRAHGLRHGRGHGRACARSARLRLREQVRASQDRRHRQAR